MKKKRRSDKYSNKNRNKLIVLFGVLGGICLVLFLVSFFFVPQIDLKGSKTVTLNYKEKYVEEGYTAKSLEGDLTDEVKVSGEVDSLKLGTYEITYSVEGVFKKEVKRKVVVKDISRPSLSIGSDIDIYLCPGSGFTKEEYTAFDNYDGDITDKVNVEVFEDKVIYSVKDSSGNETSVTKNLIYEDKESPKLTLNGSDLVYAFVGEGYNDLGVKANDNCMGDVTSRVTVDSKVNTSVSGKYDVIYNVSDNNGNTNSIKRSVVVSERNRPGTVYLTFDDGPQNGTTNVILDILKEEGVEATFFVTSKGPDNLIKRMHDEGHTVALHTATHNYATVYASVDSYFNDLITVQNRVKNITGQTSYIIRFPGGSSNTVSRNYSQGIMSTLTSEVVRRGYRYYDWNVSSGDAAGGSPSSEQIKNNVINSLRKDRSNMVLMHDIKACTRDALRSIIRYGKENGYTFEKITMNTEMVRQRVNN